MPPKGSPWAWLKSRLFNVKIILRDRSEIAPRMSEVIIKRRGHADEEVFELFLSGFMEFLQMAGKVHLEHRPQGCEMWDLSTRLTSAINDVVKDFNVKQNEPERISLQGEQG